MRHAGWDLHQHTPRSQFGSTTDDPAGNCSGARTVTVQRKATNLKQCLAVEVALDGADRFEL
jgi:hypothetical protein